MPSSLEVNPEEREKVIKKILSLSDDQIWKLLEKFEIGIVDDFNDVITEIRENGEDSINLDMLLDESSAQSISELISEITKPTQN